MLRCETIRTEDSSPFSAEAFCDSAAASLLADARARWWCLRSASGTCRQAGAGRPCAIREAVLAETEPTASAGATKVGKGIDRPGSSP
jgi:hypothetical protein